ncbi:calcium-binding mitochondrial carrier protein Aralar2 [Striga asiatica]|uniref:Calcium-binding mitochondrial carrier protein Aralar2 n=1 Tax=Striga asiatica TaxID=4170 RepID=A0A5A7QYR5_STRAF|nr:calcium-binding mitochondrial carrier protein Aralar2 [Striga asiatica]
MGHTDATVCWGTMVNSDARCTGAGAGKDRRLDLLLSSPERLVGDRENIMREYASTPMLIPEHLVSDRVPVMKEYARIPVPTPEHLAGDRVHIPMEFAGIPPKSWIYRHLANKSGVHSDGIRWDSIKIWDLEKLG